MEYAGIGSEFGAEEHILPNVNGGGMLWEVELVEVVPRGHFGLPGHCELVHVSEHNLLY